MKAIIQRVKSASVTIASKNISNIGVGVLVFLGITKGDEQEDIDYLVKKIAELRIFKDQNKNMNLSVQDVGGDALVVSQFTLCAYTRRGRRPSFVQAAEPLAAKKMYNQFCIQLQQLGVPVSTGTFGKMMNVQLINDGPVTILLDSKNDK